MQAGVNQLKQLPSRGLKQVKVDNWGTFFLQRLQQLYYEEELLDLTIKFPTSDITVQAHRLVITTCTDYFTQLERQLKEKDDNFDGILVMPPEMPYECVKSIISFMYTGQLEYWTSEQNALYRTAQKMNMTVLTKLLDAQFNTTELQINPSAKPKPNIQPVLNLPKPATSSKKIPTGLSQLTTLPSQPLPGRKLPIWKRKLESTPSTSPNYDIGTYHNKTFGHRTSDTTPGPSRFDLPEVEDFALGVFSSFDDITYNTKPIVKAPSSQDEGDNDKVRVKRSRNQDTHYKNDSTEDEEGEELNRNQDAVGDNSDDDWGGPKSILRPQESHPSPTKRVRFDLEEKENVEKTKSATSATNSADAINNHAKIIREVLKKYPHLVGNNKNIRLKIMQKEAKSAEPSTPSKTKVSYVVLKSDHLMGTGTNSDNAEEPRPAGVEGTEAGPWKCSKCDIEEEYASYYMFRRHMQDVHEEKYDPRICEHCGYKATKRNILMYHLYTMHNVPPPKSMNFPKCHVCSYVALSDNLLVRHQINRKHRPTVRQTSPTAESVQCSQCVETFADVNELANHEINTGHGNGGEIRDKPHCCPHCNKLFVRATNLEMHIDCVHKDVSKNNDTVAATPIALEPSSEAEALSHVASGIAASLGVSDAITSHEQVITTDQTEYIVPEMDIADGIHTIAYNGQEVGDDQQMVMLIDNNTYQQQEVGGHEHTVHQLNVAVNEQIVMQGDEDGMIVYVHENDEVGQQDYQVDNTTEICQETEEIVEEVVEEVEEEVEEVEEDGVGEGVEMEEIEGTEETEEVEEVEEDNEREGGVEEQSVIEEDAQDPGEEVGQYVEEETEILEYQEEQLNQQGSEVQQIDDSEIVMEEQQNEEGNAETLRINDRRENVKADTIADEWDDDSADAGAS